MGARTEALPAAQPASAIDSAGTFFWNFLKQEMTPYPGRLWVVGRMTIAATIVMVLVMVFRIPGGFQAALFTLLISRENPNETFIAGFKTAIIYMVGTIYVLLSIVMMVDDPLTHFLWVFGSLLIFFFLLHVIADYGLATPLGFAVLGSVSIWDSSQVSTNTRVETTLWFAGGVALAVVVTVIVEYVFRRVHPATDLTEGIGERLQTVEGLLKSIADSKPLDKAIEQRLSLYSSVGVSRLRRLILRSDYGAQFKAQMATTIALLGRLVDISASLRLEISKHSLPVGDDDRERCRHLADEIEQFRQDLIQRRVPRPLVLPSRSRPSELPFLTSLEETVAMAPKAFTGSDSIELYVPAFLDEEQPKSFFVPDAFTNPAHWQFALRGTLAAMVCYILYTALDWPGISTSVVTCFVTALSTIGSSRQKQVLRLSGAVIGGFVFGMGAQIFVLPYLDTIGGFAVLFAIVTVIAAWFQTASGRLSYLGVQMSLAFYLINLQEFAIQTSLSIARDRVVGVLLGIVSMGVFFDLLWARKAEDEMQTAFARNLEMFAELAEQLLVPDKEKAIRRIRQLRDQLNAGFLAVNAQSDAVMLDFSPARREKLRIREDIHRWQPSIRTLLLVQVTSAQYLFQRPVSEMPAVIAAAVITLEKDIAQTMRSLSNLVHGKATLPIPDVRASADRLRGAVQDYFHGEGKDISPEASDLADLAESLASILAPLALDVEATFASRRTTDAGHLPLQKASY